MVMKSYYFSFPADRTYFVISYDSEKTDFPDFNKDDYESQLIRENEDNLVEGDTVYIKSNFELKKDITTNVILTSVIIILLISTPESFFSSGYFGSSRTAAVRVSESIAA